MEPADDGVYFVDAGDFLGLLDRIDNAAMAARGQHDEAFALDQIGGRDFVVKIVGNLGAGIVHRRHFFRKTAPSNMPMISRDGCSGFSNDVWPMRPVVKA